MANNESRIKRASPAQIKYLEQLLIDCGFNTLKQRNAYLSRQTVRDIEHLDDVYASECSRIIDDLKAQKQRSKVPVETTDDSEDWW